MKCPICNGRGSRDNYGTTSFEYCYFCHGKQNLDWIECIFGINPPEITHDGCNWTIKYDIKRYDKL
jgi:hypothetical protein